MDPQDLSLSWHNPAPPPLYNPLLAQTIARIIADFQAQLQAQAQRLEAITHLMQSIEDEINFQAADDPNQQLVVEETTQENLDSTITTILSGEEAEIKIGNTIIDEEKSTIMSEEMDLETWWEDLEEPNYEEENLIVTGMSTYLGRIWRVTKMRRQQCMRRSSP